MEDGVTPQLTTPPTRRSSRIHARWHVPLRRHPRDLLHLAPARLLVLSFALLIGVGTVGLRVLPGLYTGPGLSWTDALFMATSATCVTGLAVVDTATYFTTRGQLWLLALIQLGGLGLLTFTSGVLLTAGRRLSLRHQQLVAGGGAQPTVDYRALVRRVLRLTVIIELTGAALLYGAWVGELGWAGAAWPAVFHAVSAFCNAGFSTFSDNLMGQSTAVVPLLVIMVLVVLGALGFLTLSELGRETGPRARRVRLSVNSRLVLTATLVVIVIGAVTTYVNEADHALAGLSPAHRMLNALFASAASRTAGFNTLDYGAVTSPTAFALILLMFVGGAPGSTAGGVKVTTAALVLRYAWARLRGEEYVNLWDRSVPTETVQRAMSVTVIGGSVLVVFFFILIAVEPGAVGQAAFLPFMFEATSALSTTGLSMDVTPTLVPEARLVLVVLMFVGRVGLLSAGAAIALRGRAVEMRFAHEDVAVG